MQEHPIAESGQATPPARTKQELSELLHLFLDIGEAIHGAGGEIFRVEDTITRLGAAYGAIRTDVFAITSSLEVTMLFPGDIELTRTRRLRGGGNDLHRIEAYNQLSRRACAAPMPADELRREIRACETSGSRLPIYIGSALASGAFAVFFGGSVWDGLLAALFGLLICYLQELLPRIAPNAVTVNFVAALLTGLGVCLAAILIPALHPDKIMIGDIMLLIPGISLTVAIRNILVGDTIAGILRLIESVLFATALAGGFMLAMGLLQITAAFAGDGMTPWVQLITGSLGSVGFALVFRLRYRFLPLAALGGLLNWGAYLLLRHFSASIFLACLVASALSALYAEVLAKRLRAPAPLFLIPAFIPSIPGSNLYYTMAAAVGGDLAGVTENALATCIWALGIAAGISAVLALLVIGRNLVAMLRTPRTGKEK